MNSQKETIRQYILSEFLFGEKSENLDDNLNLIKSGILDSLALLKLILFLEEKYCIRIGENEMIEANYSTIHKLDEFVRSKKNQT